MKQRLCILLTFIAILTACKKDGAANTAPVRNETGYLLSEIIGNYGGSNDTTYFNYNDKNQLISVNGGPSYPFMDSLQYNEAGQLISGQYFYHTSIGFPVSYITCSYDNDTITKFATHPDDKRYVYFRKYSQVNNTILNHQDGLTFRGTTSTDSARETFTWVNNNIVRTGWTPGQLYDSITYNNQYYNPYLTLGKHVWTLMDDEIINPYTSESIVEGESGNIASLEQYTYLPDSSRFNQTYVTTIMSAASENKMLPKSIKRVSIDIDGNVEITGILQFLYIKQK